MRVPIYVLIHNCDSYILQASHGLIPSCKLQGLSLPTASLVTFYLKKGFYGLIRLTLNLQTVEEIEKSKCETGFLKYFCDIETKMEQLEKTTFGKH